MKNLLLNKEQIKSIKYFIKEEEEKHKFGDWDKFNITSLRIHSNGDYSFKINWCHTWAGIFDDYWLEGNLFDELPIFSVLDGLDAVKLLFHKIHIKACNRAKDEAIKSIKKYNDEHEYLKQVYEPGSYFNKENKNIE